MSSRIEGVMFRWTIFRSGPRRSCRFPPGSMRDAWTMRPSLSWTVSQIFP